MYEKIKICFIQATNPFDVDWHNTLSFGYLKESIKKNLADHIEFFKADSIKEVIDFNPHILGVSSTSQDFEEAILICKAAGIAQIPLVILGGFHITAFPETLPECANIGVIGEGEITFLEIVRSFCKKGRLASKDLSSIPGIVFRNDQNKIILSEKRPVLKNLDMIFPPDRKFGLKYGQQPYLFTSRGCPYSCSFCASSKYWPNVRFHSPERIISEIEEILKEFPNIQGISIWDDLFTADKSRLRTFLEVFENKGLHQKVSLGSSVRANLIDDELCGLLKRLNYTLVGFGAESGSDRILKKLKDDRCSVATNQAALDCLHRNGFQASCGFVLGHYDETEDDILKTYNFILDNYAAKKLARHEITILTPMPGTTLWDWAIHQGYIDTANFKWNRLRYLALFSNKLNCIEDWIKLREENNSLYLNETNIPRENLYQIISIFEDKIRRGDFSKNNPRSYSTSPPALSDYFLHRREEIIELVPEEASSILDVGCAGGMLGKTIKEKKPISRVVGIEINNEAASLATHHLDSVYNEDIESFAPPFKFDEFDCIIFADILEHLKDPWNILINYIKYLKAGGTIIASIPNVRNLNVLRDLVQFGSWRYADEGILDRTHLRFFTKKEFVELLQKAEIRVDQINYQSGENIAAFPEGPNRLLRYGNLILLNVSEGDLEELRAQQIIFVGTYLPVSHGEKFLPKSGKNIETRSISKETQAGKELKLYRLSSIQDYYQYISKNNRLHGERAQIESNLIPPGTGAFVVPGYCSVCRRSVDFQVDYFAADNRRGVPVPNWRERLICPSCGLNNRMRAAIHILCSFFQSLPAQSAIYIAEQTTPVYGWLRGYYPQVIGSEYLGNKIPLGSTNTQGIRNEDLTALTFPDRSFDSVLTFDVFEHVADYRAAFRECWRVLKKGGKMVFTAPFDVSSPTNIVRAKVKPDGSWEHLLPPEYHGDPLNLGPGCLCVQIFGWEMLEELKRAGFDEAHALLYWSRDLGYLGGDQIVFTAAKNSSEPALANRPVPVDGARPGQFPEELFEQDQVRTPIEVQGNAQKEPIDICLNRGDEELSGQHSGAAKWNIQPQGSQVEFQDSSQVSLATPVFKMGHHPPFDQQGTSPADRRYRLIQTMVAEDSKDEMLQELRSLVVEFPEFATAHNDLGVLLFARGEFDEALKQCRLAVKHDSGNATFLKNLADVLYLGFDNSEEALSVYLDLMKKNPNDMEVLSALGRISVELNHLDTAETLFRRLAQLEPNNQEAQRFLSDIQQTSMNSQELQMKKDWNNRAEGNSRHCIDYNKKDQSEEQLNSSGKSKGLYQVVGDLPIDPQHRKPPIVSIVIPVFNKVEFTRRCLDALIKHTPTDLYELIFVDNNSTDGTREFLSPIVGNAKILTNQKNQGFTLACNQGAREAKGDYIVFLNNDTEPQPGWLNALTETMKGDASIGIAGSMLVYPDGRLQEAGGIVFRDGSGWNYGRFDDPENPRYNYAREVDYVSGAALLIRRDLLKNLGYFDDQYSPGYYEDTDLCFQARAAGYKVVYCPFSRVIHHEGISSGTDLSQGMKKYQVINQEKFVAKWKEVLKEQPFPDPSQVIRASQRNSRTNILIIDPFLPLFDRASGSLRLFQIIGLLRKGGHHVTYIARNGLGQETYVHHLQKMGVEVYATDPEMMQRLGYEVPGRRIDLQEILTARSYQSAILSFYDIAMQYLPLIRKYSPQTKIFIDTVDIHFVREVRRAELEQNKNLQRQAEATKKAELGIYQQADAIITVTEKDWEAVEKYLPGKPHVILPNVHAISNDAPAFNDREGLLFVGNFNHTPNGDAVRYFLQEIFPLVRKKIPEMILTIVGNNPPEDLQKLNISGLEVAGYVPSTLPYLQRAKVAVVPLRYGAGMKGKVGEALAHGLPVVSTSMGAEGMGLENGQEAMIADNPEDFARNIIELHTNPQLWQKLSAQGRKKVRENWSPEKVFTILDDVFSPEKIYMTEGTSEKIQEKSLSAETLRDKVESLTSIIIPAKDNWEYTRLCLDSLVRHAGIPYELVIVDNGSVVPFQDQLRKWKKKHEKVSLKYLRSPKNLGFSGGCNLGIKVSTGNFIIILNNDTVITPGLFSALLRPLVEQERAGITGPVSNYVTGEQMIATTGLDFLEPSQANLEKIVQRAKRIGSEYRGVVTPTKKLVGLCLAMKRETFSDIGGFDERFYPGNFEDVDYSIRAIRKGYSLLICREAFLYHFGNRTFRIDPTDYQEVMRKNLLVFMEKWGLQEFKTENELHEIPLANAQFSEEELYFPITNEGLSYVYHPNGPGFMHKALKVFEYSSFMWPSRLIIPSNGRDPEEIQKKIKAVMEENKLPDNGEIIIYSGMLSEIMEGLEGPRCLISSWQSRPEPGIREDDVTLFL